MVCEKARLHEQRQQDDESRHVPHCTFTTHWKEFPRERMALESRSLSLLFFALSSLFDRKDRTDLHDRLRARGGGPLRTMKTKFLVRCLPACLLAAGLLFPAAAQDLRDSSDAVHMEEARRRAAQEDLRRMHEKMREFVRVWNDFVYEYSERGTFNIKKAKQITSAWRKLEREGTWPKKER